MKGQGRILLGLAAMLGLSAGCFAEDLREIDLTGSVKVPVELAGTSRDLGIVFVGVYAEANDEALGYTYPFMGPVVGSSEWGNSYPYGGTTVGRYSFPCVMEGKCRVITGRYPDLRSVMEMLELGQNEEPPWTDEDYWDVCQEYFGYSEPGELEFTGVDRLNFHEEDGYWVADWKIWHVDPQDDAGARPVLWAFVDNGMQSCNPDGGASNRGSGAYFREGAVFEDVLNMPGKYITAGDLHSSVPTSLEVGMRDGYEIVVDSVSEG